MKVYAMDQATKLFGHCLLENGRPTILDTIVAPDGHHIERIIALRDIVLKVVDHEKPDVIVMEDYAYTQHSSADAMLKELGGVLKVELYTRGYRLGRDALASTSKKPMLVQTASTMKKFCLGCGNMKKDSRYLLGVMERMKVSFKDDNQADAYMHAFMAGIVTSIVRGKAQVSTLFDYQQTALIAAGFAKFKKKFSGMTLERAVKSLTEQEKCELVGW